MTANSDFCTHLTRCVCQGVRLKHSEFLLTGSSLARRFESARRCLILLLLKLFPFLLAGTMGHFPVLTCIEVCCANGSGSREAKFFEGERTLQRKSGQVAHFRSDRYGCHRLTRLTEFCSLGYSEKRGSENGRQVERAAPREPIKHLGLDSTPLALARARRT